MCNYLWQLTIKYRSNTWMQVPQFLFEWLGTWCFLMAGQDERRVFTNAEKKHVSMASSNPTKTCVNSESYPTTSSPFPFPRQDGFTQPYLGCLSIRRLYMIWMKKNQSKSTIQWNVVWVEPYTVKRLHCNPENLCICHLQWRDTSLMGAFSVVMRVSHE